MERLNYFRQACYSSHLEQISLGFMLVGSKRKLSLGRSSKHPPMLSMTKFFLKNPNSACSIKWVNFYSMVEISIMSIRTVEAIMKNWPAFSLHLIYISCLKLYFAMN